MEGSRPPIHSDSITASHYALDSHAVRKRETERVHLDGFFAYPTRPYTVPYGVIVPKNVENLLTPVPVSGTHVGFSTLRMEPCWMALGQAAGTAASVAIRDGVSVRRLDIFKLQQALLRQQVNLIYFRDAKPGDEHFEALQFFALRGFFSPVEWEAGLTEPVSQSAAENWIRWANAGPQHYRPGQTKRGELLARLYQAVSKIPSEKLALIKGKAGHP